MKLINYKKQTGRQISCAKEFQIIHADSHSSGDGA